jgi:acetyltransferase-like isoleucine patch superfamily enzyme
MLINNKMLAASLGISLPSKVEFENLGLIGHSLPRMLTFVEEARFIPRLSKNPNIKGVFVRKEMVEKLPVSEMRPIVCEDPRHSFYTLYNFRAKASYRKVPSSIHSSVIKGPNAYISKHNVKIGRHTVIEPGAIILSDVTVGNDCRSGAGSVLGCEDAEVKQTSKGFFRIVHDGLLRIGDRVEIGANCTVDKGFSFQDTVIGIDSKLANRTYIGHSVQIGQRCMILGCIILGSAVVEDDARINPGAVIANQVKIGAKSTVSIGSVVVESVDAGRKVSGNFAVDNDTFLYFLAETFGPTPRTSHGR